MTANSGIHHRCSLRLSAYDYSSAGFYFVTICVQRREPLFGEVVEEKMNQNAAGRMVAAAWTDLPSRFPNVIIDQFTIMPNHFHGIILINNPVGAPLAAPSLRFGVVPNQGAANSAKTLGDVIRAFKSISAINVNRHICRSGRPLWQRNYYERIIRSENELHNAQQYIHNNPMKWATDQENPANHP